MKTRKSSIYIRLKRNLSIHSFLYFLVISVSPLIMSSCASVHPFIMEVRQPAQVSLPLDIAEVIVVDNSLSQPSDIGITQSYNEKPLDSSDIELNLSPSVIQSLSQTLLNANFFNDVSYARTPVREQGDWITEHTQIPLSVQNSLMDTLGYDGIISLDRILFSIDEKVKDNLPGNSSYPSHYVDLKITAQANGSIYIYNQEKPFHLFTVSNSITVKDTYYEDSLTVIKYLPEVFLRDVAHNIGIKAANIILPSWSPKERYIYSGVGARMREAFS
ncbi:DUF6340 family protein, partial [Bacteroidales bacterium OttesenSCG-928-M06]|nr:DUF6340 family protein [Bacteroidales bacterium OttesenSCG-928-M06]